MGFQTPRGQCSPTHPGDRDGDGLGDGDGDGFGDGYGDGGRDCNEAPG